MKEIVPVRVSLKLHPQINARLEEILKKMVPKQTKQQYIENAVARRLSQDWKNI
jgi:hypothetical protein